MASELAAALPLEALLQVLKCHKIFNKYFNLLAETARSERPPKIEARCIEHKFLNTASAISAEHLKCFISIFSYKAILLALENYNKVASRRQLQQELWWLFN